MNEQLHALVALQDLEIQLDTIRQEIIRLIRESDRLEAEAAAFEQETEGSRAVLAETRKNYRSMESDVQAAQARVQKSETSLRSVKTNREYQTLLKEIEDQKKKIWDLEEAMLEHLEGIETEEARLKERVEEGRRIRGGAEVRKKELEAEREKAQRNLDLRSRDRNRMAEGIPRELVGKYRLIQGKVGPLAVVSVKNAVCSGCHMNIPPQMYNELQQKNDIVYCPHCQRMIYWKRCETDN